MKKPPIGTPPRKASEQRLAEEQAKRVPLTTPSDSEETTPRRIADGIMDTLPSWKGENYHWRISYSGRQFRDRIEAAIAREKDLAHTTAERERDELRELFLDVKAFHDRDQGRMGYTAEYEHLRLRLADALSGKGET